MFVSCISGVFNTSGSCRDQLNPVYPAVSYWVVSDAAAMTDVGFSLPHQVLSVCPSAEVKEIKSLRNRHCQEDVDAADCGTLYIALKDHRCGYISNKISRSLLTEGVVCGGDSQRTNATLAVSPGSRYLDQLTAAVDTLRAAGLYIRPHVLDGSY